MPLCERVYHCQNCGQVMDRDLNGSINLENWTKNADSLWVNACGLEGAASTPEQAALNDQSVGADDAPRKVLTETNLQRVTEARA